MAGGDEGIGIDKAAFFWVIIAGLEVIESAFGIVDIAPLTDGFSVGNGIVGGLAGNGTFAPGVVQILGLQNAVAIVDSHHVALPVIHMEQTILVSNRPKILSLCRVRCVRCSVPIPIWIFFSHIRQQRRIYIFRNQIIHTLVIKIIVRQSFSSLGSHKANVV